MMGDLLLRFDNDNDETAFCKSIATRCERLAHSLMVCIMVLNCVFLPLYWIMVKKMKPDLAPVLASAFLTPLGIWFYRLPWLRPSILFGYFLYILERLSVGTLYLQGSAPPILQEGQPLPYSLLSVPFLQLMGQILGLRAMRDVSPLCVVALVVSLLHLWINLSQDPSVRVHYITACILSLSLGFMAKYCEECSQRERWSLEYHAGDGASGGVREWEEEPLQQRQLPWTRCSNEDVGDNLIRIAVKMYMVVIAVYSMVTIVAFQRVDAALISLCVVSCLANNQVAILLKSPTARRFIAGAFCILLSYRALNTCTTLRHTLSEQSHYAVPLVGGGVTFGLLVSLFLRLRSDPPGIKADSWHMKSIQTALFVSMSFTAGMLMLVAIMQEKADQSSAAAVDFPRGTVEAGHPLPGIVLAVPMMHSLIVMLGLRSSLESRLMLVFLGLACELHILAVTTGANSRINYMVLLASYVFCLLAVEQVLVHPEMMADGWIGRLWGVRLPVAESYQADENV